MRTWAKLYIRRGDRITFKTLPLDVAEDMQEKLLAEGTRPHNLRLVWPVDAPNDRS